MAIELHPVFSKTQKFPKDKLNRLAKEIDLEVFEKTNCLDCGNCCKSAPPIVTKKDIKRIAKYLNSTPKQIYKSHVLEDINGELSFDRIPCAFLGDDNYCSIYEARPNACRDYPHLHNGDFNARRKLHSINSKICPAVSEILDTIEKNIHQLD